MTDFDSIWSPAKVFSPTVAKQQSLQQKDWIYVDQFLSTRFAPDPVPKFERNPETLKALLALASANESADEEKALEHRVKEKALDELQKRDAAIEESRKGKGEPLLVGVEDHLTPEGRRCLNSVALLSVALRSNSTEPRKYVPVAYSPPPTNDLDSPPTSLRCPPKKPQLHSKPTASMLCILVSKLSSRPSVMLCANSKTAKNTNSLPILLHALQSGHGQLDIYGTRRKIIRIVYGQWRQCFLRRD